MVKRLILAVLAVICSYGLVFAQQDDPRKLELNFFFSPTCHVCHEVNEKIITPIEIEYSGNIRVNHLDISIVGNYKLLLGFKEKYGLREASVPSVQFADRLLIGKNEISGNLAGLIREELAREKPREHVFASSDILKHFFSFTPVTVIGAGLIDGINPCAFTVIVFFISFLALQGYRKKELALIGLFFIFSVFLTYLLIGLGLFSFFYSLKGFWVLRKVFNSAIGILSLVFGIMAVSDLLKFQRSGKTEGMSLQLPPAVKNQIHKVIGMNYRRDRQAVPAASGGKNMASLLVTALVTGFLVSILEAVCTGQVYLPTITFVLKSTGIKVKAFAYLVLYNLMFVLPLFVIFLCALAGATSEDFSRFLKKHFLPAKILMALLFFVLGVYLVWRA